MPKLERHLGLPTLTLNGIGVMVGAGIYVLIGKIAGTAGNMAWLAFVAAALAALPTGLSYAELSSRYPRAAGEVVFVERAGGGATLSFLVGYLILASGVASTAAVSHGFAGYFAELLGLGGEAHTVVAVAFLLALSLLNHRGIEEAAWVNVFCTIASVGALLVLVIAAIPLWGAVDLLSTVPAGATPSGAMAASSVMAVVGGAALSFYAYIGFEDICNVAEEVKQPIRTVPRAILLSLGATTVIYVLVAVTAVSAAPIVDLAASDVPLIVVSRRLLPGVPVAWLAVVALFATTNTALFNLVMASRIVYGMANQGWIPRRLARVHARRHTPTWGVAGAFVLAAGFALTGVLRVLAEATNTIILLAFLAVNASLIAVKLRRVEPDDPTTPHFEVPLVVPIIGVVVTAYMFTRFSTGAYVRAGALLAIGLLLFVVQAPLRRRGRLPSRTRPDRSWRCRGA